MAKTIYLDNGATSFPKPEEVYKAVDKTLRTVGGSPGRSSHTMAIEASRIIFETRESLARLLNIPDATRIIFTKNSTEAINTALKGLLRKGDHVVTSSFEHNAVAKTLAYLEKEHNIKVTKVKAKRTDYITAKEISDAITTETKLVTVMHASNVLGTIQPIKEIAKVCHDKNVLFMADCAQTIGSLPFDAQDIDADIVAGTGHKALLGPQGVGFLYLKEGIEPTQLIHGGTGFSSLDDDTVTPDRFESGTMNTPGIAGLGAGIQFILNKGIENIRAHEVKLIHKILEGISNIDGVTILGSNKAEERTSLVSFTMKDKDPAEIGKLLDRGHYANIMVRTGEHCSPDAHKLIGTYPAGAVRVSPGIFTTEEEIDIFIKVIKEIATL